MCCFLIEEISKLHFLEMFQMCFTISTLFTTKIILLPKLRNPTNWLMWKRNKQNTKSKGFNQPWVYMCLLSEPPSYLPSHPIPQGCPSEPALNTLSNESKLDRWYISLMVIYMFQWYSFKSSHPRFLSQSTKVCSLHLRLFCYLAYRGTCTPMADSCESMAKTTTIL